MKKILSMLGLAAALLIGANAQAQTTDIQPAAGLTGGTNNIAAETTNTTATAAFAVTRSTVAGLTLSLKLTGSGTTPVVVMLDSSLDGSNWKDNTHAVTVTPAGTAVVSNYTNFTVGAVAFFRVGERQNANATAVTNLTLTVTSKPGL